MGQPVLDTKGVRLYSDHREYVYSPGENVAWCTAGVAVQTVLRNTVNKDTGEVEVEMVDVFQKHDPIPAEDCTCGFYVLGSIETLRDRFPYVTDRVVCEVDVWGKCIPYLDGYRAEKIQLRRFLRMQDDWFDHESPEHWEKLSEFYDVPIEKAPGQVWKEKGGIVPKDLSWHSSTTKTTSYHSGMTATEVSFAQEVQRFRGGGGGVDAGSGPTTFDHQPGGVIPIPNKKKTKGFRFW